MSDFPTEASPAGTALALVAFLAPLTAIILSAVIKSKTTAFLSALGASFSILLTGVAYSLHVAPGSGTLMGALAFGGGSALLSLFMTCLIVGSRTVLGHKLMPNIHETIKHTGTPD